MTATKGSKTFTLDCHPQTQTPAIVGIDVALGQSGSDIRLKYRLVGNIRGLRIPDSRHPQRMAGLWRHSCFEIFVMAEEGQEYLEFNFSPSGEWTVYAFRGYRDGGELEIEITPDIRVKKTANWLELEAVIPKDNLPPGRQLRVGLSAVVEDAAGELSYWALHHPPGEPDFHHNDAFAALMELT